jgi:uncharacterized protein YcbK (DUF882 family)
VKLSDDFDTSEFLCHGGGDLPADIVENLRKLCTEVLQPLRDAWGSPLVVISGYRSPAWNERVGGAKASQHMLGLAADVRPVTRSKDLSSLERLVTKMAATGGLPGLGGMGFYPGRWIHLDARPHTGRIARWEGKSIGSEVG